jgi:filamentous hemagglutinin family protein
LLRKRSLTHECYVKQYGSEEKNMKANTYRVSSKSRGFNKTGSRIINETAKIMLLSAIILVPFAQPVYANPEGGTVSAGSAVISSPNSQTTNIHQFSQNAVIDWNSFNIASGEKTAFFQPNSSSIALNRINSAQGVSQIFGTLEANGKIILLNPAGIYFGPTSFVNVGGLLATTANISNSDFMSNHFEFRQSNNISGAIINEGTIKVADMGMAGLVAPAVANRGMIVANLGTIQLASGTHYTIDLNGNNLIQFAPDSLVTTAAVDQNGKVLKDAVSNTGTLSANGGKILITANAAKNVVDNVINMGGVVEARSILQRNGQIILSGGNEGIVNVTGKMTAHTIKIKGHKTVINGQLNVEPNGFVETSGNVLDVNNMELNLGTGATWLIDPAVINIQNDIGSDPTVSYITPIAISNALDGGGSNIIIQTDPNLGLPGSGDININDSIHWSTPATLKLSAYHDINFNNDAMITNNTNGKLILQADNSGIGIGTVNFSSNVIPQIDIFGGSVKIYYSPAVFGVPTDFSNHVALFTGLTAYMLVNDVDHLQQIYNNLDGNYALGKDIDASATAGWNTNIGGIDIQGFLPLGNQVVPFTGLFDGQGYVINNLTMIDNTNYNIEVGSSFVPDIGLFGVLAPSATVSNLHVKNSVIQMNVSYLDWLVGFDNAFGFTTGGIAGTNNGTIQDSSFEGIVAGFANVGGIAGSNNGTIIRSYAIVQPQMIFSSAGNPPNTTKPSMGYTSVGGLVGRNTGSIDTSFSLGTVVANYVDPEPDYVSGFGNPSVFGGTAGGLVGRNDGNIFNTFTLANVIGGQGWLGGFAGYNGGSIENSYSTGYLAPSAFFREMGGFVGIGGQGISNSFWDVNTGTLHSTDGNIYPLAGNGGSDQPATLFGGCISPYTCTAPTDAMLDVQNTFTNVNWDFEDIWVMNPDLSPYPTFQNHDSIFVDLVGTPVVLPPNKGPELPNAVYYVNTAQISNMKDYGILPIFVARKDCPVSQQYNLAKSSIIQYTVPRDTVNLVKVNNKWVMPVSSRSTTCLLYLLDRLEKNV